MERDDWVAFWVRVDRRRLWFAVLFAVAAAARNYLLPTADDCPTSSMIWVSLAFDATGLGAALFFALPHVRSGNSTLHDWGIKGDRNDWFYMLAILAAGVYFFAAYPPRWSMSMLGMSLAVVLQVVSYELVLRANVMTAVLDVWKGNKMMGVVVATLSATFVYSIAISPMGDLSITTNGSILALSILFYFARKIGVLAFFVAVAASCPDGAAFVSVFSIIVYVSVTMALPRMAGIHESIGS